MEGLAQEDVSYTSGTGKTYDFNTADKLNTLLLNCLLKEGEGYDVDFDHQFIETEKYDAKLTYKKFLGYHPGVAVIGDILLSVYTQTPRYRLQTYGRHMPASCTGIIFGC